MGRRKGTWLATATRVGRARSGWEVLGVKLARRSCPQDKDVGEPAGDNTAQYNRHTRPSSWGDSV